MVEELGPPLVVAADALKLLGAAEEFELRTTQSGFSADSSFNSEVRTEFNEKFAEMRSRPNETWSFLPSLPDQNFKNNYQNYRDIESLEKRQIVEMALLKGLPMPTRDVSFEDILNFKEQKNRSEQIRALHETIDEFIATFVTECDSETALKKAISRIEHAVDDVEQVYSESFQVVNKRLLKSAFVFGTGAFAGSYIGSLVDASPYVAELIGATVTTYADRFAVAKPESVSRSGLAYALEVKNM